MKKRIVITGLGIVSPIGIGIDAYTDALKNGVSGANPIGTFDVTNHSCKIAAHVKNYNPEDYIDRKKSAPDGAVYPIRRDCS